MERQQAARREELEAHVLREGLPARRPLNEAVDRAQHREPRPPQERVVHHVAGDDAELLRLAENGVHEIDQRASKDKYFKRRCSCEAPSGIYGRPKFIRDTLTSSFRERRI